MNKTILVVDDSSAMRQLISSYITECACALCIEDTFTILRAEDGVLGLATFNDNDIDMLITDWNMPNMNGLELIKAVRATPKGANTPILMITTEGSVQHIRDAVIAGATQYVAKPFTEANFIKKFKKIMSA